MKLKLRSSKGIWFLSILTFAGVAGIMLFSTYYMNQAIHAEEDAQNRRMEYRQLGEDLADASDYLTTEVRYYAVTGKIEHLYNYWEEIFETRERERVIAAFEKEDSPENEKVLLEQAKQFSDLLVETETYSMKLVLLSKGKTAQEYSYDSRLMEYVSYVLDYEPTDQMKEMTAEEMREKAINLLYDENYEEYKNKIMTPLENFTGLMNERMDREVEKRKEETRIATIIQIILAAAELIAIGFLLYLMKQMGRFVAAKNEAELASEAKSTFLAQMSHELRTPLNAVNGYTYLLENTSLNPKQREYIQGIRGSSEGLLELINQILDFSKTESGCIELESAVFRIRELLGEVKAVFLEQAERKGLFYKLEIDENVPDCIEGDSLRLRQVLVNLIGNAFKFTEEGGVTVSVRLLEKKGDACLLHFSVADTGIGVEEEAQEKIFQPFTQSDVSVTRKYGGTGLGLSISREIIMMSGNGTHQLEIESEPGKGSVFRFDMDFPCSVEEKKESRKEALEQEAKGKIRTEPRIPQYRGKKVLVTDDSEINIRIQSEILSLCHLMVLSAESGMQALEILKQQKDIDLIFMDIRMPQMDGYETVERIRRLEGYQETPIIALTADAVPMVQEKIKEAGMNDILLKPVSQEKLLELLVKYLPEEVGIRKIFDMDTCLGQLNGNQSALQHIVERFLELHREDAKRLEAYIAKKDYRNAEELVHQLKGISGNLECRELYDCCRIFQQELGEKKADRLEEFIPLWNQTIEALEEYRQQEQQESRSLRLDKKSLYEKLLELSCSYDTEAVHILEEHIEELREDMTEENYRKLKKAMLHYDFKTIREMIECTK